MSLCQTNDSAGKLKQGHVVGRFLFMTDQEFAESIEERARNLNDPAMCAEVGVAFQLLLLLTSGPNIPSEHCVLSPFFPRSVGFFLTDSNAKEAVTIQPSKLYHS